MREMTTHAEDPGVAVLGNHDYESGQQDEDQEDPRDAGVATLDGDTTEIHGIGFAGVKGFAGGFGGVRSARGARRSSRSSSTRPSTKR